MCFRFPSAKRLLLHLSLISRFCWHKINILNAQIWFAQLHIAIKCTFCVKLHRFIEQGPAAMLEEYLVWTKRELECGNLKEFHTKVICRPCISTVPHSHTTVGEHTTLHCCNIVGLYLQHGDENYYAYRRNDVNVNYMYTSHSVCWKCAKLW